MFVIDASAFILACSIVMDPRFMNNNKVLFKDFPNLPLRSLLAPSWLKKVIFEINFVLLDDGPELALGFSYNCLRTLLTNKESQNCLKSTSASSKTKPILRIETRAICKSVRKRKHSHSRQRKPLTDVNLQTENQFTDFYEKLIDTGPQFYCRPMPQSEMANCFSDSLSDRLDIPRTKKYKIEGRKVSRNCKGVNSHGPLKSQKVLKF